MRTQRKLFAWIMAFILTLSIIPTAALADEAEDNYTLKLPDVSLYAEIESLKITNEGIVADENGNYTFAAKTRVTLQVVYSKEADSEGADILAFAAFDENNTWLVNGRAGNPQFTEYYFTMPANNCELQITGLTHYKIENGTLIFTGWGEISTCGDPACRGVQLYNSKEVKKVIISEGITAIGEQTFAFGSSNEQACLWDEKTMISLPSTLTEIKQFGLSGCNLTGEIKLPAALKSVGKQGLGYWKTASVFNLTESNCTFLENALASYQSNNYRTIYLSDEANIATLLGTASNNNTTNGYNAVIAVTNGGTFSPDTQFSCTELEEPLKKGYIFDHWEEISMIHPDKSLPCGHTYSAIWKECTSHEFDEGEVTTAATCTEAGKKTYTCTLCDETKTEDIPALGHSFTNYIYNNDATYDSDGTKTAACDRGCGTKDTVTAEGTKLVRTSSGGTSSSSTTTVSVSSTKNGTVTVSPKAAKKDDTVTITVKPDDGYELNELTVTDKNGKTVKVTEGKNGKFTFTMPAIKVTVEATFSKIEETQTFIDVPDGYWAEDAIAWVYENGYMNGNSAVTFNPEGTVTRQQLWMILARLSGYQPADFTEAKAWAVDNGISDGTVPGNAVSRQQLVTILYRYAVRMGYNTSVRADLTQFSDHTSVASYATDAMAWSVANGIVGGTTQGTLNPAGTATRAQFAVILNRFCEKIAG